MSSELRREIRKLEARLEDYIQANQKFVNYSRKWVKNLKELTEKMEETDNPQERERLRREIINSLGNVLQEEGDLQHERSHIWESYGALILALKQDYQRI
ncbi:MAG: hypothetical protein ACOC6G_00370 [Thermoproteota archaeon]